MQRKSTLREYAESFLFSVVVVLFVRTFLAEAVQIPTRSMEDTLLPGDHLFINKFVFRLYREEEPSAFLPFLRVRRRDVVVFKHFESPGRAIYYVKRVIGLPGDAVEIRSKQVYINGEALDEPYALFKEPWRRDLRPRDNFGPLAVTPNHFFVLGDNRDRSYDSRFWGLLARERIVGKPMFVWWSFETHDSPVWTTDPGAKLEGALSSLFRRIRWSRTGKFID
ncbi:MAG: signal peptidase I [Acidobacteriota bacterium]